MCCCYFFTEIVFGITTLDEYIAHWPVEPVQVRLHKATVFTSFRLTFWLRLLAASAIACDLFLVWSIFDREPHCLINHGTPSSRLFPFSFCSMSTVSHSFNSFSSYFCRSLLKRLSAQSARLQRSNAKTGRFLNGSACEQITQSNGTPSVVTGAEPSWVCKQAIAG